mgnify:CR=1 FL=1
MGRVIEIPSETTAPSGRAVLTALGLPEARDPEPRVQRAVDDALEILAADSRPRGTLAAVRASDFARVYAGEGKNESPSPLADIFPRADALLLFAATLGAPVSDRITSLFDSKELTLAVTLDAAASIAVELAGDHLEVLVVDEMKEAGAGGAGGADVKGAADRSGDAQGRGGRPHDLSVTALRYSPGYCGWDLTGQRALFGELEPERIGIRLLESCLMEPLKSISGVIVAGPAEIHEFTDDYAFCSECRTRDCRRRIAALAKDSEER